jgi:hypothetical protein
MVPLSDGIPARRFPVVNVTLIVANFAVFLLYGLPNRDAGINQASFYPCDVTSACRNAATTVAAPRNSSRSPGRHCADPMELLPRLSDTL